MSFREMEAEWRRKTAEAEQREERVRWRRRRMELRGKRIVFWRRENRQVQGDPSRLPKPIVDIDLKVAF